MKTNDYLKDRKQIFRDLLVWARDYMPLQLEEGRFLQDIYNPDYLNGATDYIPPYFSICRSLKLNCRKAMYVIDGGNVVKFKDCVIMTDKVLKENKVKDEDSFRWFFCIFV